jgi:RNA polymerase sigma-70 factor (ECF subfamily)
MTRSDPPTDPVEQLWRDARAAWPGLEVELPAFEAHVARCLGDDPPSVAAALNGRDLYLACACAAGDAAALQAFEREVMPATAAAVRRFDPSPGFVDEVRQQLRAKLFVPAERGAAPKIASYAGRGPLVTWVRVVAVRLALDLRSAADRERPTTTSQLAELAPDTDDPGMRLLKERFAAEFKQALHGACERLNDRDRTVLRLRFVDGVDVDQIAAIYGTHRTTVSRWIRRIREELFAGTRDQLRAAMRLADSELDSMLRIARSRLDVSLSTVLDPGDDSRGAPR